MGSLRRIVYFAVLLFAGLLVQAGTVRVEGDQVLFDGRPVDLIGVRCSNALMSDRTTDELIAALDLYQSYGLNTVSVFLMGSRFGDIKGYLPDGSMSPVYLARLEKILNATQERGMMMIVGGLYWGTSKAKEDLMHWTQEDADRAIAGTAAWLAEKGFTHVILDPDNEGMAGRGMKWETESMVRAAQAANPALPVANNTRKEAPSADLTMHFGAKVAGKPWLDSESTPTDTPKGRTYWGKFSKEAHQADKFYYNYSRIGRYTEEMKRDQIAKTVAGIEEHNGIILAGTWLQCAPAEGVGGPFTKLGGLSEMGSNGNLNDDWNREIDRLHPDAGVRWWFEYVRDRYGPGNSAAR